MRFLHPLFLLALSAMVIPIIIHLFHFRRFKKVYFSNISFLEKLNDETQRQARLKHLLVLFSRMLAIAFLVMAFARPFIPLQETDLMTEGNRLSIYIDNSFSMESGSSYGNLLDQAKQRADEIAKSFSPTDEFQLLTNDFEARHQRFVSRDEFLSMVSETDFSPSVRNLPQVMARQADMLKENNPEEQKLAFVLSDFQKNTSDFQQATPDSLVDYFFIPFSSSASANVFIDSLWIDNPVRRSAQIISLQAQIYNDSDQRLENQPVRLYINNNQRAVATFDVPPFSHAAVELTYTLSSETIQQGYIEITDHPVTFDDKFHFSFNLSNNIPVLILNEQKPNRFLNALLGADTTFTLTNMPAAAIDVSLFSSQNLIILNELNSPGSGLIQALGRYVREGGNLLVFPSENISFEAYNELMLSLNAPRFVSREQQPVRVSAINELHPIYSNVFDRMPEIIDLPEAEQYYLLDRQTRDSSQYLLQLQNGHPFLLSTAVEQGNVYVAAVPASDAFSNFTRHAIFVPTIFNIAMHSTSFYPLYYTIGLDESVNVRNYEPSAGLLFRITNNQMEVIPEARNINNNMNLILHGQIQTQGNYNLLANEELLRVLAFNYDRRESLLESLDKTQLQSLVSDLTTENVFLLESDNLSMEKQLDQISDGQQLWKIFLLIALLFLLAEVLLLRLWK